MAAVRVAQSVEQLGRVLALAGDPRLSRVPRLAHAEQNAARSVLAALAAHDEAGAVLLDVDDLLVLAHVEAGLLDLPPPAFQQLFAGALLEPQVALVGHVLGLGEQHLALVHVHHGHGDPLGLQYDVAQAQLLGAQPGGQARRAAADDDQVELAWILLRRRSQFRVQPLDDLDALVQAQLEQCRAADLADQVEPTHRALAALADPGHGRVGGLRPLGRDQPGGPVA